jgi:hypothetical protein
MGIFFLPQTFVGLLFLGKGTFIDSEKICDVFFFSTFAGRAFQEAFQD